MSQHKENSDVKQSPLDPDKMENEAEHFKDRETDSTSRPSSRESKKTVSSASSTTSVTSEIASMLVSETLDRAAANINELMQSISRWEAEERSKSEADDNEDKSSAACCTHQKVEQQLQRFFGLRRVFAEHQGETPEDTEEDLVTEMDSTTGPSGQEGHHVPATVSTQKSCDSDRTDERSADRHGNIYKKMKSAWKRCFRSKPRKNVQLAEEQDLDETAGSEGSDSKSGSPCPEETSPTASSSEDIRAAEKTDLVTDMDGTPGPSLVLPGAEHVDEVVRSASSDSTSKDTNLTKPGSPFPREMSFTEMDAPSQEDDKDVCETFLTVSTQKSCDSDRTDEKSAGRHGSKIYKKMKSAWKRCFRSKPRKNVQLAEEQDLDETVGSEGSDSKSGSPCPEETSPTASMCSSEDIMDATKADLSSVPLELVDNVEHKDITTETEKVPSTLSPTGSSQPAEHHEERSAVMEEDLVINMDSPPGPPGQDGHLEPSQVHLGAEQNVAEIIKTASSDLTSGSTSPKDMSPTASIGSSEDIRDATKADLSSVPLELVDNVEHKDITTETEKVPSTLSPTGSSQPAEHHEEKSAVMEEDLVTNMDSPPGPSGQDGHLEPSQVHLGAEQNVDEIIKTASSDLTSGRASPKEMSPTASIGSSEDIKAAEKADLSSVPLELVDNVEHKDITTETEKVPSTLSPTGSSQPAQHHEERSAVMEEDLVTNMDSPPGPSGQDGHLEPSQVHLGAEQNVDEIIKTASSDLTSGRASPKEMSPTASIGSSEDIKAAEKADLSSVPLEQDNDVTPEGVMEEFMEDNLVKDIDAAPGSSLDVSAATKADLSSVPLELVDVDVTPEEKEDVASKPSTTSSSPPAEHHGERSSVTEKDLVMYRDSTPGPSGQDRHLEGSQEDNGAAAVPQLTGLKNTFYTIIKGFFDSLTEEQQREISKGVYNMDVKEKLADMCAEVLKLVIETITDILSKAIYQFAPLYGTLTTRSPTSSQVCGTEAVGQKLPSELLRENFDITEDNIQQSLKGSFGKAFCDVVGADTTNTSVSITPKFTEAIVRTITDEVNSILSETIQASLDGESSNVCAATCCQFSRCRACKEMLAGVIRAMNSLLTGLGTARKKTIQTVRTQKHSDCESKDDRLAGQHTIKVHQKKLLWWSCFCKWRKTKVHPISDEQESEAVRLPSNKLSSGHKCSSSPRATSNTCSVCSSKLNSTPLELVDYVEDEDATSEETGNAPSSYSIGWFPPACLEDEVIVPDYQESPSLSETQTEVRGSSCHQSGDSGDGNCQSDVGTEEVVMAASDTDVNETQAEKSNRICQIFRKGKKEDAVRIKRPSLLKRIRLFCHRLSCCSHDDVEE